MPRAQFRKWSLSASFQRPVTRDLLWLTSLYGQWSPDRLYGSERLTLGGESSVRGFKEQYISGDNGGYWRNELNYALFTLPVFGANQRHRGAGRRLAGKDRLDRYASGTVWGASSGPRQRRALVRQPDFCRHAAALSRLARTGPRQC